MQNQQPTMQSPTQPAGFYAPQGAEAKIAPSPAINEVTPSGQNASYFGAGGAPVKTERPFSTSTELDSTPQSTPMPGSPLPAYAQGAYVPPPPPSQPSIPPNTHQLHSDSAGPMLNAQGQQVYEAPAGR